jgi:hypothetical protein
MARLQPPSSREIAEFRDTVTVNNPGIGILDRDTGKTYLAAASAFEGGDHLSLVEDLLGIRNLSLTLQLRGFVVVVEGSGWRIVNCSGLNPRGLKMEAKLFGKLETVILSALRSC